MQKKKKKRQIAASIGEELDNYVQHEVETTGIRQSEIIRQALHDRYENGGNESAVTLNLVLLMERLNIAKEKMRPEDYKIMSRYIDNIMIHKGGN